MRKNLSLLLSLFLCAGLAQAETKPVTPQQEKMKTCNAEAKTKALKGDERKAFMSECLKKKPADGRAAQQEKMKACNADPKAKELKGDERKAFMAECLKG